MKNGFDELTALYYIWKRDLIRFVRAKSRIVGSLGMPFFLLAALGMGMNVPLNVGGNSVNYLQFIAPGILAMVLLFGSVFSGVNVIVDRQFGFLKETLVAPVGRTTTVIGKSMGGATTAMIQGILMLIIAMVIGVSINWMILPVAILLMILISMAFVSLGIAIASTMEDMHGFQLIMNFMIMPMFFLSGALFPLSNAPKIVQYISYINPMTYAVEALRFLFMGYAEIPFPISVGVLIGFFVVATLAAVYLFNKIEE